MYSEVAVINELQQQGYTEDFRLNGNELLWIQGKTNISPVDFSITERYFIQSANDDNDDVILYGITSDRFHVRGILSQHYNTYPRRSPPLIINKLAEMYSLNNLP